MFGFFFNTNNMKDLFKSVDIFVFLEKNKTILKILNVNMISTIQSKTIPENFDISFKKYLKKLDE